MDEFRNHLTLLAAATTELGGDAPPAVAGEEGGAVFEAERKVRDLTSLVALVDASRDASTPSLEPVIAPLGAVVDRAVQLATAAARITSIVSSVPRGAGVRNRGAALEGLLAALIVDLAKARPAPDEDCGRASLIRVDADVGRRGLAIEVSCQGARLDAASSWRFVLAGELAAKLGATLTVAREVSTYVVQFALTSS